MKDNEIPVCTAPTYVHINKLAFHPKNPRTITPNRLVDLKNSITEKGVYQPFLVWKKGGYVLSGNHRLLAARELVKEGWVFVDEKGRKNLLPVVVEDVTTEVAEQILYESNNSYADWVEEKVRAAIKEAEEHGRNISSYGFTQDQVDQLLVEATKEADEELDKSKRSIEGVDPDKLRDAVAEDESQVIVLKKETHERFVKIVTAICLIDNKDWVDTDPIDPGIDLLCRAVNATNLVEKIRGSIRKKRGK